MPVLSSVYATLDIQNASTSLLFIPNGHLFVDRCGLADRDIVKSEAQ